MRPSALSESLCLSEELVTRVLARADMELKHEYLPRRCLGAALLVSFATLSRSVETAGALRDLPAHIDEAVAAGVKTLVIGVANRGGLISDTWKAVLKEALEKGMDIASGLHNLLRDEPELVSAAKAHGRELHDVRIPTVKYPIASGVKRKGKRCLAVGTDCSVGKMYTALAMEKEMASRSIPCTFRATGVLISIFFLHPGNTKQKQNLYEHTFC